MTIHIPRPRLLLTVLGVLAFCALAYTVVAEEGGSKPQPTGVPFGIQPELPQVTAEEREAAQETLRRDATFQRLAPTGEWKLTSAIPNTRRGEKIGVGLVVELTSPMDSTGPWRMVRCQGTVSYEFTFPYRGVSTLGAVFTDNGTTLIGLTPLPSPTLAFDDADLADQPPLPACPRGSEDEEN